MVVVYRGTIERNLRDWIDDLWAWRATTHFEGCVGCLVHSGFMSTYQASRVAMLAALDSLQQSHPGARLFVTGHSLGAALASLAAADLRTLNHRVDAVYTMGEPRVGNVAYAKWYGRTFRGRAFRVVHAADVVPHLPPQLYGVFRHAPTEVWYPPTGGTLTSTSTSTSTLAAKTAATGPIRRSSERGAVATATPSNGTRVVCDGTGEDPSCSDSLPPQTWNVEDHMQYLNVSLSDGCVGLE